MLEFVSFLYLALGAKRRDGNIEAHLFKGDITNIHIS